jgi:hypothetical protein
MLAATCALASTVAAQPAQDMVGELADFVLKLTTFQVAFTSVGVEQCGKRNPSTKESLEAAYNGVRSSHLDFFVKVERSKEYLDHTARETARFPSEKEEDKDKFCTNLPAFIENLSQQVVKIHAPPRR